MMLKLDGNSEWAFATKNSINAIPIVYAEWNYNLMQRPFVVVSSSTEVTSSLGTASAWTAASGGTATQVIRKGYKSIQNPKWRAIEFELNNSRYEHFRSRSITVTPDTNQYYKMVFYIKAESSVHSGNNDIIPASAVEVVPNVSGSTHTSFYRITQVTKDGVEAFPNYDDLDIITVKDSLTNTYNILHWDALSYGGPMYNIYYGDNDKDNMGFIDTVPQKELKFDRADKIEGFSDGRMRFKMANWVNSYISDGTRFSAFFSNHDRIARFVTASSGTQLLNYGRTDGARILNKLDKQYWQIISSSTQVNGRADADGSGSITITNIIAKPVSSAVGEIINDISGLRIVSYPDEKNGDWMNIRIGSYTHNITSSGLFTTRLNSFPIRTNKLRIMPSIFLKRSSNILENAKSYIKIYETDSSESVSNNGMIEIDGINYKKVEIYFGSVDKYDSIQLDLAVDSSYSFASFLLSQPKLYKIEAWEFNSSDSYPIEDLFKPYRPGEALLNPYLKTEDMQINKNTLGALEVKTKPVSFSTFNPDRLYDPSVTQPYKQVHDNHMNNTIRHYVTPQSAANNITTSIMGIYDNTMSVNKIVVKSSNAFLNLKYASGNIVLKQTTGSVVIPFEQGYFSYSGLMDLYWNGLEWSLNRPTDGSYPPKLTDSGTLQNVIENVTGIILNIDNVNTNSKYKNKVRAQFIEISPRLEIDVSPLVESFTVEKSMDDANSAAGFPMSYINANSANLIINNVPVYRNGFPFTAFDDTAQNATFYGLMRQGVKFIGALRSPNQDFTDIVPMFNMYADTWAISDIKNITVHLFDNTKAQLMATQAPDYFGQGEGLFQVITNIFDAIGFSDYDYDGLRAITRSKSQGTSHFWCDRTLTVFEAMQSFFAAHQIGAFFDEYGIMRFIDIDKIIDNYLDNSIYPDFAVTDIPISISSSSIEYIPNLISESYSHNLVRKIGKVSLEYQIPIKAITDQITFGKGNFVEQSMAVWKESGVVALPSAQSIKSILASDTTFAFDPEKTAPTNAAGDITNSLATQTGTAFIQGESISWNGFEYLFNPYTQSASLIVASSAIVASASPFKSTASIMITSPSANANTIKNGMLVYGGYIEPNTFVTGLNIKQGKKINVTGSVSSSASNPIITSTGSSASTVVTDMVVTGTGVPVGTYVKAVSISSPSTFIVLSALPTSKVIDATFRAASVIVGLSASTSASGSASTSASVTNFSEEFEVSFFKENSKEVNSPLFAKSMTAIISDASELNKVVTDYSNQDTRITGIIFGLTGKAAGMTKGNNFTSKRNHILIDDARPAKGYYRSGQWFNKSVINSASGTSGAIGGTSSSIIFDNNVAKFTVKSASGTFLHVPVLLSPRQSTNIGDYQQPVSASLFNYYSFQFKTDNLTRTNWGSDKKIAEIGIYIATDSGNLMFCLANDENKTYLKSNLDLHDNEPEKSTYFFGEAYLGDDVKRISSTDQGNDSKAPEWKRKVKNVFDGKVHRLSVLFHNEPHISNMAQRRGDGKMIYQYVSFKIDDAVYGPYKIYRADNVRNAGNSSYVIKPDTVIPTSTFGFYVRNTNRSSNNGGPKNFNLSLYEIYACEWWEKYGHQISKTNVTWHWRSKQFLNDIIAKKPYAEPNYYYWGPNSITGIKIYDNVSMQTSPANVDKLEINFVGFDPAPQEGATVTKKTLHKTTKDSVQMSNISATPFRLSFAIVNTDNQLTYLSAENLNLGGTFEPISVTSTYNKLTDPVTIEKIIDASSIGNSIQMSTKWVQTQRDAKELLEKIAFLANTFNNEISVSIYGNPLIQVGDTCQFIYSLKGIGYDILNDRIVKRCYLVKSVGQNFNNGLTTELILKPLFQIPQ